MIMVNAINRMRFTVDDLDVEGLVKEEAIERENRLLRVPFPVSPSFLKQLYTIACTAPEEDSNEKLLPGRYIEVQVGRHVDSKYMFRFIF